MALLGDGQQYNMILDFGFSISDFNFQILNFSSTR